MSQSSDGMDSMEKGEQASGNKNKINKEKKNLDPKTPFGNMVFLISFLIAISLDPLFFYVPLINNEKKCLHLDEKLGTTTCIIRTIFDLFYVIYISFRLRDDFYVPLKEHSGRNSRCAIRKKHLLRFFLVDLVAILPLPQIAIWSMIPTKRGSQLLNALTMLKFSFIQSFFRLARIYPLTSNILSNTTWVKASYNLLLYMIVGHVFGAFWYFLAIERMTACWKRACINHTQCNPSSSSFYCRGSREDHTFVNYFCPVTTPNVTIFDFGIFHNALRSEIVETTDFPQKLVHCFQWGLQSLSCFGQNLQPSTYVWENLFVIFITVSGLVLFILLIGNMETYLQSKTMRSEEMRLKSQDIDQWMSFKKLSKNLRKEAKEHQKYVWQKTRGVDVESVLNNLPKNLRRDIKRELYLELLKKVQDSFKELDDGVLDELCECARPVLYTNQTTILRKGDRVDNMLFIVQGKVTKRTSKDEITRTLEKGDFCGEELLIWALYDPSSTNPNRSTYTFQAIEKVEGFVLMADDLQNVFESCELQLSSRRNTERYTIIKEKVIVMQRIRRARRGRQDVARSLQMWKPFNELHENLMEQVKKYQWYICQKNKDVDLESVLNYIPKDLRRNIKRKLCLKMLEKVKEFEGLGKLVLDALCACVKPVIYNARATIVHEGDMVHEMLFIVQGQVRMYSKGKTKTTITHQGIDKSEHDNSIKDLRETDFCGKELIAWAQYFPSPTNRPRSTTTIQAARKVEAFALMADDLKNVYESYKLSVSSRRDTELLISITNAAKAIQSNWRGRMGHQHVARSLQMWRPFNELPANLKEQVKKHLRLVGRKNKGVDVQSFLSYLPKELRMDIKRELCLNLLKKVKEFKGLNETVLTALCDHVKPIIYDFGAIIVYEGDPVQEVLLIVLGKVRMYASKGKTKTRITQHHTEQRQHNGRIMEYLGEGNVCGEELIAWAQYFPDSTNPPRSTSTIQAAEKVEAFALTADDLETVYERYQLSVSSRRNTELVDAITHAARVIQSNWRQHKQ